LAGNENLLRLLYERSSLVSALCQYF